MKTWLCVLILLPAFALRPVAVSVHNGGVLPITGHGDRSSPSVHSASFSHWTLRVVERGTQDLTAFAPPAARVKAPSISAKIPNILVASFLPSREGFHVLRI